jgi:hypothetical protein
VCAPRSEIRIAATHELLLLGASSMLEHPAIGAIFVTDTAYVAELGWPRVHLIAIELLPPGVLERFLTDASSEGKKL